MTKKKETDIRKHRKIEINTNKGGSEEKENMQTKTTAQKENKHDEKNKQTRKGRKGKKEKQTNTQAKITKKETNT